MIEKGLVQIYTGNGKGKTTAAFGLAIRAAARQNNVLIYQFLKPPTLQLGERMAVENIRNIHLQALEHSWGKQSLNEPKTKKAVTNKIKKVLKEIAKAAAQRKYNVIILDEIIFCHSQNLVSTEDIKALLDARDPYVEIVMTGRGASKQLINLADLVTEMKSIKHPYEKGILAREGIEY